MKYLILKIAILFAIWPYMYIFSQDNLTGGDVNLKNLSSKDIWVRVYPVSMVFNVDYLGNGNYDLHSKDPLEEIFYYINGRGAGSSTIQDGKHKLIPNQLKNWNMEGITAPENSVAGIGRGIYRFEFYYNNINNLCDSAIVEWDAANDFGDLTLTFDDEIEPAGLVSFHFATGGTYTLPTDRKIYSWEHAPTGHKTPGDWVYDGMQNLQLLPQDFRMDCENENHSAFDLENEWRIGILTLNMTIKKDNITTQTGQMLGAPHKITITPYIMMTLDNNIDYTLIYNDGGSNYYNMFTVNENACLKLNPYSTMTFENTNQLILECHSHLILMPGARIIMQNGSKFCNRGATTQNSGRIIFQGIVRNPNCTSIVNCNDNYIQDSAKFVIEKDAVLELPDSSNYIFQGNETALLCDSGSTIKFGKGSKLVFTDGARINAKHTKFTTYDSNTTWNGIYLNDVSYDTLQFCTIENALNGINIEDKISYFGNAPATEISNCTFSNKTSEQLLNMVYVNNSANVMVRNCSSSTLINDGFASGVIVEYCTAGGVNVIDNEISYVTTGINVIQSSPYIARNTITGAGSSGTGLYLDNSNGTIEYNIVDNFEKSTVLYYSSPYMLKNTFSDANTACADVTAYSVPVMKPVASGTTLRWLGGNNYFTGSPSDAGITLENEGHPLMDSGYNVINVGNSLYMQGTISRVLYMRVNNWCDDPPVSGKFDISGEEYDYSEYFDGYTIPPTDYYELNSIGFGYYDSVYVDEMGGDNPTVEDIFILAYRKEMERKFVEAVVLYKNVITNYKNSNYAITSLSRIFNCIEKSNAGINQYSAVKSYYDGIKNSNTYPQRLREHAEDLAIKAKVRMGFIEEAISDYQTIINNNGNNPKGIHAQVNKLVLMNMNSGGDNAIFGNKQSSENHKASLLSLITGKSILAQNRFASNIPQQFKLYQNYPNPFNPKTVIKYEIPKDAQVTLTIYDLTGREILTITEFKQAGSYSYTFDGTNYASGLYFYKIHASTFAETKKMVLLK